MFLCAACHKSANCENFLCQMALETHMGASYGSCEGCHATGPCVDCHTYYFTKAREERKE